MIRVYIHGRPQGQDTWSVAPAPNDKFYINPFLDSKIGEDMSAVMQIDVWQGNSYYSYIHRKNVYEKVPREPNAYLAITVCFEKTLCTQVSTLYDLLERVYKQLCLNNIIEKSGEQERFLVSQFKEKDSVLNQMTNVILQNIDKYIVSGLISIEKADDTTKLPFKTYSTVDVDSPQFLSDCNTNRILISPIITPKDRLPIELRQQIAAIENQKAKLEVERNSWQSKAEHELQENDSLNAKQKQLQEQINTLQQQIKTIKGDVAKEYQHQLQEVQKKLDTIQRERDTIDNKLMQERNTNKSLSSEIDKLKEKVLQLQRNKITPPPQPIPSSPQTSDPQKTKEGEPESILRDIQEQMQKLMPEVRRMAGRFRIPYTTITMVATVLNNFLIIAIIVFYFMGNSMEHSGVDGAINEVHDTIYLNNFTTAAIEKLPNYSSAKIDIVDFNGGNLSVDIPYTLQLKNVQGEFSWQIEGAEVDITGNIFVVKRPSSELIISCIDSHNYIVSQRKIKAQ